MQPSGGPSFLGHLWPNTMLLKAGGLLVVLRAQRRWFSECKSSSHWELCAEIGGN